MKKVYEKATMEDMEVAEKDVIIASGGGSIDGAGGNDGSGNSGGSTGGGGSSGDGFDLPTDEF